jgi:hypothetical protein
MKIAKLNEMFKGWFIGDFFPTLVSTQDVEVAVKNYYKDDYEPSHHHKIAKEITVIVEGQVRMNDSIYNSGDIIVIEPNESTDFKVLSDKCTTCVVKIPGATNDKYLD